MRNKNYTIAFYIGYALLIIGTFLYMFDIKAGFFLFCAGVVINVIFRILLLPQSNDKRISRLNKQHFLLSVFLGAAGYLMWAEHSQWHSAWIVPILMFAVVEVWLTFRYPSEIDN